jgi:hypothetical protein
MWEGVGRASGGFWLVSPFPPPLLEWHSDVLSCHLCILFPSLWILNVDPPDGFVFMTLKVLYGIHCIVYCTIQWYYACMHSTVYFLPTVVDIAYHPPQLLCIHSQTVFLFLPNIKDIVKKLNILRMVARRGFFFSVNIVIQRSICLLISTVKVYSAS